jgi:hypothetical protein
MVMAAIASAAHHSLTPLTAGLLRWMVAGLVLPVLVVAVLCASPFLLLTPGGARRWRDLLAVSPLMRRRAARA